MTDKAYYNYKIMRALSGEKLPLNFVNDSTVDVDAGDDAVEGLLQLSNETLLLRGKALAYRIPNPSRNFFDTPQLKLDRSEEPRLNSSHT